MSRTTEQWEALLNDTTPGPWRLSASEGVVGLSAYEWDETPRELANIRLASTAPAAVAEVVRLRQAMTRLRDTYAAPDDPGDDYGRGMEAAYQIAADDLTRILEGDNDE